jgi:hypothetical protein
MGGALTGPSWRVAAASVVGAAHLREGTPCQDAHRWALLPNGAMVAAVADGAGSAPRSATGAALAVRAATAAVASTLGQAAVDAPSAERALRAAMEEARLAIEGAARAAAVAAAEMACTLIVCLAIRDGVWCAQVGDGSVVVQESSGEMRSLGSAPRASEYLNETSFLTSPNAAEQMSLSSWTGEWSHLAMLSDGLQTLALTLPGGAPHRPFFEPLFRFLAAEPDPALASDHLAAFLGGPRISSRCDDDLTLVLVGRC